MNEPLAYCTLIVCVITALCSIAGFRDAAFLDRFIFSVREILAGKEFYRVFTSSLLHADWPHLLLNLISLYLFGRHIEWVYGPKQFLFIYAMAVVGGSLLSLWIHRHHEYRAYGASGGVCGVIFSYIFLFPGSGMIVPPLPFSIPGWLYAILYLIGSFAGLKRQKDNIGHDAHIGGALIGLLTATTLHPEIVKWSPKLFAAVTALSLLLFFYLIKNPLYLPTSSPDISLPKWTWRRSRSGKPPVARSTTETARMDAILEKISHSGIQSLTVEERKFLERVSQKHQNRTDPKPPSS